MLHLLIECGKDYLKEFVRILIPQGLIVFQLHGIKLDEVVKLLEENGAIILSTIRLPIAIAKKCSYAYFISKQ